MIEELLVKTSSVPVCIPYVWWGKPRQKLGGAEYGAANVVAEMFNKEITVRENNDAWTFLIYWEHATYKSKKSNLSKLILILIEPSVDITENVNDEDKLDSTSRNEDHIDDTEVKSNMSTNLSKKIVK